MFSGYDTLLVQDCFHNMLLFESFKKRLLLCKKMCYLLRDVLPVSFQHLEIQLYSNTHTQTQLKSILATIRAMTVTILMMLRHDMV